MSLVVRSTFTIFTVANACTKEGLGHISDSRLARLGVVYRYYSICRQFY